MNLRVHTIALLLLTSAGLNAMGQEPPPEGTPPPVVVEEDYEPPRVPRTPLEYRRHAELRGADDVLLYEYTVISVVGEEKIGDVILLRDPDHGDVLLEHAATPNPGRSFSRISDVKKRTFIEVSMGSPLTSKTFSGVFREAHANPELWKSTNTLLTITTNGGEWRTTEAALQDEDAVRRLRHEIRPAVDIYLLEAIERMRGTFFSVVDGHVYGLLIAPVLLYDSAVAATPTFREPVVRPPACDFDKYFGYPCSAQQLKRIEEAEKSGKKLDKY